MFSLDKCLIYLETEFSKLIFKTQIIKSFAINFTKNNMCGSDIISLGIYP